jgi:nitrite reductase/ring-hydroxylating ferredoxin subunit
MGAASERVGWQRLCTLADLPENGARGFTLDNNSADAIFVVRRDGLLRAYRDICPHYGRTRLAWRRDAYLTEDLGHILCSAHGAEFSLDTGICVVGPCLGQSLEPVPVELRGDDLWIRRAIHQKQEVGTP